MHFGAHKGQKTCQIITTIECFISMDIRKIDSELSNKLSNASFLFMGFIVGIHVLGHGWQTVEQGSALWYWVALGQYGLFNIAVPFFFMCSGFLFAGHIGEDSWWFREVRKRISSLLVPYVLWCIIYLILIAVLGDNIGKSSETEFSIRQALTVESLGSAFGLSPFRYPAMGPLWYIRALLLYILVSPFFVFCIVKSGALTLSCLYLICMVKGYVCNKEMGMFFTYCFNLWGLFYFCLGIYGRLYNVRLPIRWGSFSLAIGVALVCLRGFFQRNNIHLDIPQNGVVIPMLLFGVWSMIPSVEIPKFILSTTFPIFLIHTLVFHVAESIGVGKVVTLSQWGAKWFLGFFGSIAIAILLRGGPAIVSKMLFGGRL